MKITTALMLVFMTCTYGSGKAQKISLSLRNAKLEDAFKEISKQTKYKFLYSDALIKDAKRVNVQIEQKNLDETLSRLLAGNKMVFKIIDETITINARVDNNIIPENIVVEVQNRINGVVKNTEGTPLAGASISVKGSTVGTTTDGQGAFSIQVTNGQTLVIKYIGYIAKEVPVGNQSTISVTLMAESDEIEEVVVTGLGAKIDRRLFTGATTKVDMKDIELGGLPDPSRALEGRVAGVIVQNTTGTFGTAPKIRVRGATSIYGNSKPLWVVDGMIIEDVADIATDDLSSGDANTLISSAVAGLNSNDIESFQILKDGSATSIYGARAMGGVIVITTKKGKAGMNSFNYSGEYTYRAKPSYNTFNIMNSQEQMEVYQFLNQRGYLNLSNVVSKSESGVYGKMYDLINQGALENTPSAKNAYLRQAEFRNTNWFDELFENNIMHNHSVSMRSGTEKAQYYTSLSAVTDPGWSKRSDVKRYTAMINSNYNILDNLTVGLRANGSYRDQRAPGTLGQSIDVVSLDVKRDFDINPYSFALNSSRTLDPKEFYRRNYAPFNILHELENNYMDVNAGDIKFQGELNWKVIKPLEISLMGAIRYQQTSQQHHIKDQSNQALAYRWMPSTFIRDANPLLYTTPDNPYAVPESVLPQGGIYNRTNHKMLNDVYRLTASFDQTFNLLHRVYVFAGADAEKVDRNNDWFRGWGLQYDLGELPFTDYRVFKRGAEENSDYFRLRNTRSRQVAFYGTANYSYANRYSINGTLRYEGTNRLGRTTSARWMPTWNISGLWNVHEEDFFKGLETPINNLAFKASYSLTADRGPSNVTNSKIIIESYNPWRPSSADRESGLRINTLENSELTYEKKYELNLGASMGLFQNRISVDVDYYKRKNYDLIGAINTQGLGGEIIKYGNAAEMHSKGLELAVGATLIRNDQFSWATTFNYTRATNKVTEFISRSRLLDLVTGSGFAQEGYPVRSLFSIPFNRLTSNGLPVFNYMNGTETTTGVYFQTRDNLDFLKYEGPTDPTDLGGFSNVFNYQGFRLELFLTYSFGNAVRLDPVYQTRYSDLTATTREFWDAWTVPGEEMITNVPVIIDNRNIRNNSQYAYAYNGYNYSTVNIAKGDFVRLKNVSLTYNLPKQTANAMKMSSLSVRLNAVNPWLIYADKRLNGQDPEFVNSGGVALPIARMYTMTLNIGF